MQEHDPFDNGLHRLLKRSDPQAKVRRAVQKKRPGLFGVATQAVAIWLGLLVAGAFVLKAETITVLPAPATQAATHAGTTAGMAMVPHIIN